ncbi:MAG: hypothetical protein LBT20_08210 [Clostridiales bacterium]|jgi:hypothetical protein|nr:hypothetical protein [Clostridiales bacterium]
MFKRLKKARKDKKDKKKPKNSAFTADKDYDPLGMYTGTAVDDEMPVQDADDL